MRCWAATCAIEKKNRKGSRMRVSCIRCFGTFGHHCYACNTAVLEYILDVYITLGSVPMDIVDVRRTGFQSENLFP